MSIFAYSFGKFSKGISPLKCLDKGVSKQGLFLKYNSVVKHTTQNIKVIGLDLAAGIRERKS